MAERWCEVKLTDYIREQARVADGNSKEWAKAGSAAQAAYRAGMWYAYNDVEPKVAALAGILQRNIAMLRTDLTREDYLQACDLLGIDPHLP